MGWYQGPRNRGYSRSPKWGGQYHVCPCGGWAWAHRGDKRCRDCGALFEEQQWPTPAEGRWPRKGGEKPQATKSTPVGQGGKSQASQGEPEELPKISGKDAEYLKAIAKLIKETKGWDLPIGQLLGEDDLEKSEPDKYKALVAARHKANQAAAKLEKSQREVDRLAEQLKQAQVRLKEHEAEHTEATEKLIEAKKVYGCEAQLSVEEAKSQEPADPSVEEPSSRQGTQGQGPGSTSGPAGPGEEGMEVDQQTQEEIKQLQKRIETLKAETTKRRRLNAGGHHTEASPEQILAEAAAAAEAAAKATEQVQTMETG